MIVKSKYCLAGNKKQGALLIAQQIIMDELWEWRDDSAKCTILLDVLLPTHHFYWIVVFPILKRTQWPLQMYGFFVGLN